MYQIGNRLLTLDGAKFGNGIITGYILAGGEVFYDAETDFGNVLSCLTRQEIDDTWAVDKEHTDITRWYTARDELRSRSSVVEQGTVDAHAEGSIPSVTAILAQALVDTEGVLIALNRATILEEAIRKVLYGVHTKTGLGPVVQ